MACPTKLNLRILYTINSSPQYILARSRSPVPVSLISDTKEHSTQPKFATVSLKACLNTICRSSPELIQDNNRDYSVYVLDPLESSSAPAPMNISNSNNVTAAVKTQEKKQEQPCAVAVGLGLMSWALHADERDGAVVTGTQVRLGTGQGALEVIFALRETAAMQRTSLSTTMQSWGQPLGMCSSMQPTLMATSTTVDPNMLQLTNPLAKQVHCENDADTTVSSRSPAAAKTLAAIRARNKVKSKPKKVPKPSTTPTTESDKLMYASETYIGPLKKKGRPKNSSGGLDLLKDPLVSDKSNGDLQFLPETKPGEQNSCNSATESTKIQSSLSKSSAAVVAQTHSYNSLMELLASMSNASAQNAALLATFGTIDSSTSGQQIAEDQEPNPLLINALKQLLSSCIKQTSQNASQPPPSDSTHPSHGSTVTTNQDEDVIILDKENVDPLAFRRRGDKDFSDPKGSNNVAQSGTPPTDSGNPNHSVLSQRNEQTNTTTMRRKRTLSDFMDERESERVKQKERERTERRELHRQSQPRKRRTSGSNTIYDRNPNDLRHYPRLAGEALPRPGINSYYRASLETRSSPPRPKSNADVNADFFDSPTSRRSRTKGPASSPSRPNPGAQSRQRYVVPEWARTNTATQPRLSEEAQRALAEAEEKKKMEREAVRKKSSLSYKRLRQESRAELKPKPKPLDAPKSDPPAPVAVNDSCPVFAASETSNDIFSCLQQSSAGLSSPPRSPRLSSTLHIPQTPPRKFSMPLFTPDNASSSLFTPTPKAKSAGRLGDIASPLGCSPSPCTRSRATKMSPIQAVVSGRSIGGADGWNGKVKEDNGWDEIDGPPSSLPTASDGEDDAPTSSSFGVDEKSANIEGEDDGQELPVRQHWAGLPPSSPPPSSPTLTPQDQDDDDMELIDLPVPTSDIEESTSPSFQESDSEGTETAKDLFDPLLSALSSDGSGPSDLDIFAQLSSDFHVQNEGNIPITDPTLEPILQNGLIDFDFTEFWESFKPMVQDYASAPDANKLAEDIQALFGGCLM